jgi:hypothetical protein
MKVAIGGWRVMGGRLASSLHLCLFLLLIVCSDPTLMAREPGPNEDALWMGQVIISDGSSCIDSKDESTKQKIKKFSRNYRLHRSVTITVCGPLYDLQVTDVTGKISESMEEQNLEKEDHRVCCRVESECRKHNPLYRAKHFKELYVTKRPGNSEFGRHSINGKLHTSSRCGPYGEKGVKDPTVEVVPVFDASGQARDRTYGLYASASVLENYEDMQESESEDVCTGKKKTEKVQITTSDCDTEPTGTRSDTGDATSMSSSRPPLEHLLGGYGEKSINDRLFSGRQVSSEAAKHPGDTSSNYALFWYLSADRSRALDGCRKTAEKILESCIDAAYHMYDFEMDREKVEAEGAVCAEGYLVKCFEDAGSIADPEERGNKMSGCVREHCNTELFPDDQPESSLSQQGLNSEIGTCAEEYLDRVADCSRDYGCH